jgi:LemA protein
MLQGRRIAMTPAILLVFLACTAALCFLWGVLLYNRLVALRQHCANALSQIDVQLKRRHDLVPNLVHAVKAAMRHERETLEAVTRARDLAASALHRIERTDDVSGLTALGLGEEALTLTLTRLLARIEAYPQLLTSTNVSQLMEELVSAENRIAFARQAFNDSVVDYNSLLGSFPALLVAPALGFRDLSYLQFEERSLHLPAVALAPYPKGSPPS